jgi:threonine dehydrogenase-like Zn-dependent dehydrogenase
LRVCFPRALGSAAAERFGVDRLNALLAPIETVRRGGTVSLIGVYAGARDPPPMMDLFDKGIQLRMGQAQVTRWIPDILPLVEDDADPLGTDDVTTHRLPLTETPHGYDIFH